MNEVEEYYLQHFGVKGMKWGVRKNRNSKGPRTYKDADGNTWTTSSPVSRAKEKGLIEQPTKGNSRSSKSANKQAKQAAKKAQKRLTKEARKDYRKYKKVDKDWTPYERSAQVRKINNKKRTVKGYDKAFEEGSKQVDRNDKIIGTTASIVSKAFIAREALRITNPQAYMKGTRVVDSVVKGAGQYAKYAAQSATPSRYTVKARDIIDAIVVNPDGLHG